MENYGIDDGNSKIVPVPSIFRVKEEIKDMKHKKAKAKNTFGRNQMQF